MLEIRLVDWDVLARCHSRNELVASLYAVSWSSYLTMRLRMRLTLESLHDFTNELP
jgi:hypothetical protein